jgi:hypothetical protein
VAVVRAGDLRETQFIRSTARTHGIRDRQSTSSAVSFGGSVFQGPERCGWGQERTMLDRDDVDEELQRGFGLSIEELEPFVRAGGDAAEMKFMECCRYLWQADGAELIEPFIEAVFNKLPDKSRCVLFQRMLTIVYLAQDAEPASPE